MLSVFIANLATYEKGSLEGEWLVLPCSIERLETVLQNIGVGKPYKEYFIYMCSSNLQCVTDTVNECSSIITLNLLSDRLSQLSATEVEKLEAIHEASVFSEPTQVFNTSQELDSWTVYPAIHEYGELGKFYYNERRTIEIPKNLLPFFNFKAYGKEIVRSSLFSRFTSYGFVVQE